MNRQDAICIYGAGHIGCYVGARLAAAGARVTLVGRGRVLDELRAHGLGYSDYLGQRGEVPATALRLGTGPEAAIGAALVLVPQRDAKEHAGASGLPRLPAAELESAVLEQLRSMLRAPEMLADMLPRVRALDPTLDEAKVTVAMLRLDKIWDQLFPAEQTRIVKLMIEKVIVSPNKMEVRLRANGIERVVRELQPVIERQPDEVAA